MPGDHKETIQQYFDKNESEHYEVNFTYVEGVQEINSWIIVSTEDDGILGESVYSTKKRAVEDADELRSQGIDCFVHGIVI